MTRFSRSLEKAIFERDHGICQICGRTTEFGDGEIEHKIPKSQNGSDDPENLQWSCHRCNKLKGNTRTNEQVRRILSLPEDFPDIMKFRTERKVQKLSPPTTQSKLPNLTREGLDIPAVEKCIHSLQTSYQSETIVDEICNKITAVEEPTKEFVHIGLHYRLPRLWFLPFEVTNQAFSNDFLFASLGRSVALTELKYLEDSILGNATISRTKVEFSPNGILTALEEMRSRGLEPTLITFPLSFWRKIFGWSENARVEYRSGEADTKLKATLKLDGRELKLIAPLGRFPKEPMLLGKDAVEWEAKRNPEGALYVVLGNHQLYPLKYVELLAGISVKCAINSKEISVLDHT